METTLLGGGGGGGGEGGWGCADLNNTYCAVVNSECLSSFCNYLSPWLLRIIHHCGYKSTVNRFSKGINGKQKMEFELG